MTDLKVVEDHKLVEVTWIDSGLFDGKDGWVSLEDALDDAKECLKRPVVSVGHLVLDDDEVVAVSLSWAKGPDHHFGIQIIYRPNVVSMRELVPAA